MTFENFDVVEALTTHAAQWGFHSTDPEPHDNLKLQKAWHRNIDGAAGVSFHLAVRPPMAIVALESVAADGTASDSVHLFDINDGRQGYRAVQEMKVWVEAHLPESERTNQLPERESCDEQEF